MSRQRQHVTKREQGSRIDGPSTVRARLLDRIPAAERRLDLAGVSTAVLEGGDGPPIVVLHGPGHFAATWTRVVPMLVPKHRVIVPDLPGQGASQIKDGHLDAARVLTWVGGLIEATCTSPPTLVGSHGGGAIAARFAADDDRRIAKLVLVDAFGLGPFRPSPMFALAMVGFMARPSERTRDRMLGQCMVDLGGVHDQMGEDLGTDRGLRPSARPHAMRKDGWPQAHERVRRPEDPARAARTNHRPHDVDLGTSRP